MGENSKISWTDNTFNPWLGCQRVSPGCGGSNGGGCYAEVSTPVRVHRSNGLELWGPPKTTERLRTSADNWKLPARWNRAASKAGTRTRVFCASLCDVFEDHPQVAPWRAEALTLLERCTALDVQLLTKRPQNIRAMVPEHWLKTWPAHIWIGCTVEDQWRAEERIPHLLDVPARVRFLSCEPLLEAVNLDPPTCPMCGGHEAGTGDDGATPFCIPCGVSDGNGEEMAFGAWIDACADEYQRGISWVIVGGESGPDARLFDLAWARSIVDQCRDAGVPVFVKQMGDNPIDSARVDIIGTDGKRHYTRPFGHFDVGEARATRGYSTRPHRPTFNAHHGADPSEWEERLRMQQFPGVTQ